MCNLDKWYFTFKYNLFINICRFCLSDILLPNITIIFHDALGCQGQYEFPTHRGVALLAVPLNQTAFNNTYFTFTACLLWNAILSL